MPCSSPPTVCTAGVLGSALGCLCHSPRRWPIGLRIAGWGGDGLAASGLPLRPGQPVSGLSQQLMAQLKLQAVRFRESKPGWTPVAPPFWKEGLLQASSIYSVHEPLLGRPPGSLRAALATPFPLSSLLTVPFKTLQESLLSITRGLPSPAIQSLEFF